MTTETTISRVNVVERLCEKTHMVGSRWSQITERATPTFYTREDAQRRCDELNDCDEVRQGNSPFFVTKNRNFAAE